jgi:hypothetical protein
VKYGSEEDTITELSFHGKVASAIPNPWEE